jgi:nitroreductase/NAD-dependent dihydropyrimidine dehydrogenase PreA subunit
MEGNTMIEIDREKCTNCMSCLSVCSNYVYRLSDDGKEVVVQYPSQCCVCGHCISICPVDAISHEQLPLEGFEELRPIEISADAMRNLILSRRSIRNYKSDPVPDDMVEKLIEAATHAGTSSNGQTEQFIVVRDQKFLLELEKLVVDVLWNAGLKYLGGDGIMTKLLTKKYGADMIRQYHSYHGIIKRRRENNEIRGMIFRNAPLVIIMHGLKANALGPANCSIAIRNMELLARTMGLGTCWCGFLVVAAEKSRRVNAFLELEKNRQIQGALMVGYPEHKYTRMIPRKPREIRWI